MVSSIITIHELKKLLAVQPQYSKQIIEHYINESSDSFVIMGKLIVAFVDDLYIREILEKQMYRYLEGIGTPANIAIERLPEYISLQLHH